MSQDSPALTDQEQFTALMILEYLSDLFTVGTLESFSRDQILVILNAIKNDQDFIDPDVLVAFEEATADL